MRDPAALLRGLVAVGMAATIFAGCGDGTTDDPERTGIGMILVGERDDLGYNQAIWEGKERLARTFPDRTVVAIEGVPETDEAVDALESLVDDGAGILFATSFGHLDAAYEVARRHPDVIVVHQGGVEPEPRLDNFGTYFGTHSEAVFAAGVAAGAATETGRIGFVGAFPIPATRNNVNALLLGARQVRPDASIDVVLTGDWCDARAQSRAAASLLATGSDVLAQHQDCTRTVLEAAEAAGVAAVGYHSDGSEVAPRAWLTGAIWTWGDLFVEIVEVAADDGFAGSVYDGDFRGTIAAGDNPFALAEAGATVSDETRARIDAALAAFADGSRAVFEGPLVDTAGIERVAAGRRLTTAEIDAMDYFLEGVTVIDR